MPPTNSTRSSPTPTASGGKTHGGTSTLNKALLDTDIFSELSKGIDPNVARNATTYRSSFGHYTLSAVTVMEVVRGLQQKQSTRRLQTFLTAIASEEVIPLDQPAAELAGRIAGELERVGRPIG